MAIFVDSCGCTSFCDECHLAWREFREVNDDPDERWLALSAPNFVRRMTEEELALRHIGQRNVPALLKVLCLAYAGATLKLTRVLAGIALIAHAGSCIESM